MKCRIKKIGDISIDTDGKIVVSGWEFFGYGCEGYTPQELFNIWKDNLINNKKN